MMCRKPFRPSFLQSVGDYLSRTTCTLHVIFYTIVRFHGTVRRKEKVNESENQNDRVNERMVSHHLPDIRVPRKPFSF